MFSIDIENTTVELSLYTRNDMYNFSKKKGQLCSRNGAKVLLKIYSVKIPQKSNDYVAHDALDNQFKKKKLFLIKAKSLNMLQSLK